jgi:hypothetical protein
MSSLYESAMLALAAPVSRRCIIPSMSNSRDTGFDTRPRAWATPPLPPAAACRRYRFTLASKRSNIPPPSRCVRNSCRGVNVKGSTPGMRSVSRELVFCVISFRRASMSVSTGSKLTVVAKSLVRTDHQRPTRRERRSNRVDGVLEFKFRSDAGVRERRGGGRLQGHRAACRSGSAGSGTEPLQVRQQSNGCEKRVLHS